MCNNFMVLRKWARKVEMGECRERSTGCGKERIEWCLQIKKNPDLSQDVC